MTRIIGSAGVHVAKDTYLGTDRLSDGYKATFFIATEKGYLFVASSLKECSRLLREKQDNSDIVAAGPITEPIAEGLFRMFSSLGIPLK